ncbi:MAG: hypothetical protein ACHQVS_00665 [Candidatus Babeliales bacterium]
MTNRFFLHYLAVTCLCMSLLTKCDPRFFGVCAVGAGLSYSGMYLIFKEKKCNSDDVCGLAMFIMGIAMILSSDNIVKVFDKVR